MQRIFDPHSIVVIGVSERPGNLARNIIINLSNFGYRGPLYAVGRQTGFILDVPIVTCLEELPDGIDLAVILTPAAAVPDLMEACGRKGIRRVVIESAGFGEFSAEGRRLEEQLKKAESDGFAQAVRAFNGADVIAPTNPVDLGTIFDFDLYARIVEECLQTLSPDAILLINTYSINETEGAHRLIRRVERIVHESGRPIAQCIYTQGDDRQVLQQQIGSPLFGEIEQAVRGLAASRDRYRWQVRRCDQAAFQLVGAPPEVRSLLSNAGMFAADRALSLCQAYGIPSAPWQVASDPNEAMHAAERLGYPVALKALSPDVIHKSDVGGVIVGLANASSVRREAEAMLARLALPVTLMVQRMVGDGVEVVLGGKRDPTFGPVVMVGLGGILVEVLEDVAFRVAPLSRADAEEMIQEVRGKRLLDGVRGRPAVDREALIHTLLSLSQMLVENPCISQVDINPLMVLREGACAVDARMVLG